MVFWRHKVDCLHPQRWGTCQRGLRRGAQRLHNSLRRGSPCPQGADQDLVSEQGAALPHRVKRRHKQFMMNCLHFLLLLPGLRTVLMALMSLIFAGLALAETQALDASPTSIVTEQAEAQGDALYALPDGFVARNPDGAIVVEEFLDYYCTFCKVSSPEVDALAAEDTDIRLVIRELPILTPQSLPLAQIALAASYQGLYLEVHKAMMTARTVPSPEAALSIVASLGGDPDQILIDMQRPEIGLHIRHNLQRALAGGIRSTPGFIVQGLPFAGYIGKDAMAELFEMLKEPTSAETKN
ncbi:MAG: hypothetical protein CMM70_09985 [Rhodospirillaceae bacterium]|nr:hypothetical protein [Rhodospirillaceae bacterium]MAV48175.1 hypothetical protein [Rhodospirillaceae bacterium]